MLRDTVAAHVADHPADFTGKSSGEWVPSSSLGRLGGSFRQGGGRGEECAAWLGGQHASRACAPSRMHRCRLLDHRLLLRLLHPQWWCARWATP